MYLLLYSSDFLDGAGVTGKYYQSFEDAKHNMFMDYYDLRENLRQSQFIDHRTDSSITLTHTKSDQFYKWEILEAGQEFAVEFYL